MHSENLADRIEANCVLKNEYESGREGPFIINSDCEEIFI